MRQFLFLIAFSLGFIQNASAQQSPGSESDRISAYLIQKFGVAKEKAVQISNAVESAAAHYSLPPAVLLAIISIESRFKEKAKGPHGATGLMQVVPAAHRGLLRNVKDLTEPVTNINTGSAILSGYMQLEGGDLDAAMKIYGGSRAYAQKIRLRAAVFTQALEPDGEPSPISSIAPASSSTPTMIPAIVPVVAPAPAALGN